MEKEKSKLGVGALVLFASGVICKFLGAFFRMPLTNLLGLEGIGVFQLIMTIALLFFYLHISTFSFEKALCL